MAEIERGVVAKERSDPSRGDVLRRWVEVRVLPAFAGGVLSFDSSAARILATYRVPERAPFDDALFAAVPQAAHLTVVTPNGRHCEPLGIACLDPWAQDP